MTDGRNSDNGYWTALSAIYGLTLSVVAMAEGIWPWLMGAAAIIFIVVLSLRHRQLGRSIQGTFATANPSVGVVAGVFGLLAILVHGTPAALWAGPLIGAASFAGMLLFLRRFGRYHRASSDSP